MKAFIILSGSVAHGFIYSWLVTPSALDISQPFPITENISIGYLERWVAQKACSSLSDMIPVENLTHLNYAFAQ